METTIARFLTCCRRRPWRVSAVAAVGIALLGVGLAPGSSLMRDEDASPQDQVSAAIEPIPGGSSVSAEPSDINGGFPCRLVGWRAADAISYFSKDNVTVQWAFESPTDSEGVGYRSTPESVPLNSIIMDVSRIDAGTVVVGVHGAQDLTHGEMPRTKRKDSEC